MSGVVLACLLAIAGCGGDDDPERAGGSDDTGSEAATGGDESDAGEPDASGAESTGLPAECDGPWAFDLRAANAWEDLPVIEEPTFEFTSALAVRLEPGIYTLYLADYELDPVVFTDYETDHPSADKTLATLTINAFRNAETLDKEFDELAAGDVVPADNEIDGERRFGVVIERGLGSGGEEPSDLYNTSSGPVGQATVVAATDDALCLDVDYTDYENEGSTNGVADEYPVQKHLAGTFSAPIVDF